MDTLRGGAIKEPKAAKRFLKRTDAEVDALTQMVEELLEVSLIESGQAPLRPAPTPVAEVMIPAVGRLRPQAERAGVVVSVHDTGVGIAAEDVPRIFERSYKADRARSGGGTGLGLAIARHIVQGHGGRVWAESVEGQRSTFYFTLQIAA